MLVQLELRAPAVLPWRSGRRKPTAPLLPVATLLPTASMALTVVVEPEVIPMTVFVEPRYE